MLDLSRKQKIARVQHWFSDVDQLYHPTGAFGQEYSNLVYAYNILQSTKFLPIVLKELFYLVKKDGYLVLDYQPNEMFDWQQLESCMWWLWKKRYKVVYHGSIGRGDMTGLDEKSLKTFIRKQEKNFKKDTAFKARLSHSKDSYFRFICKKITTTQLPGDSIDKWTFGIITNGNRDDWIERIIQSIRAQNIPHYEIIVCGVYYARNESDFKYIPFNIKDDKGWISRKKNIIAEHARFNNLCIMHDRLVLDPRWFAGMKKYGNTFEAITCQQISPNGDRAGDWLTTNGNYNKKTAYFQQYRIESLNYRDWDFWAYLGGQLTIIKKHVWVESPWNETLYWNDGEDVDLSLRLQQSGRIIRIAPYAIIKAITWRHGKLPEKNSKQLTIRGIIRMFMFYAARVSGGTWLLEFVWPKILKSKLYDYIIHH